MFANLIHPSFLYAAKARNNGDNTENQKEDGHPVAEKGTHMKAFVMNNIVPYDKSFLKENKESIQNKQNL